MTSKRTLDAATRRADFEAIALPFMGAVYNTALRLTRGGDDSGDLVQETYLRALRTFDSFTPGTNCRAWLLTILYSVFINTYHKSKRQALHVSIDELEERFDRFLESTDDVGETAATVEVLGVRMNPEVDEALRGLPDDFRDAVLFVDVAGLSYDEAAVALNCPVGTVRSRLYRGRRLLFAALQTYASLLGFRRDDA